MPDKVCQCRMFKEQGVCWHTGYVYDYLLGDAGRRALNNMRSAPVEPVPDYEQRRRAFLRLLEELRPNDPDVKT